MKTGSIPTTNLSKTMRSLKDSSNMSERTPLSRRGEIISIFDIRTIEDSEPPKQVMTKAAAWLRVNVSEVSVETFKKQLWAEVLIPGESETRVLPVRIPSSKLFAEAGNSDNLIQNLSKELDFLVIFQGKDLSRGTIVDLISKPARNNNFSDDPDIMSGMQDPLASARTYSIIGI